MNTPKSVALLFNPFVYVAGAKALALGVGAVLIAGGLGYLARTHFDGVLDTHTGAAAPFWIFLGEGLADWLCLALTLLAAGRLISRTSFRTVDLLGTQALARWPTILIALLTTPKGFTRFGETLVQQFSKNQKPEFNGPDALVFLLVVLLMIPLLCWVVLLMYRSFSVSCNIKGGKAIVTFIVSLIIAEVVSKFAVVGLFRLV